MAPAKQLAQGAMRMSKRILFSYILDWILIIGIAGAGAGFNRQKNSNKRPFSLTDPSLTYPLNPDTVTIPVVVLVCLIAPAAITAAISLILIPGPTASKSTPKALVWRRKIWEWNTAWMGLGLSLATAFMVTEGLKNLAGKPRPHTLAECDPDLSLLDQYRVGASYGQSPSDTYALPILVDWRICRQQDPHILRDTFASWPSGHSSFSFAGLLYLTLFLCAKFAVYTPYYNAQNNERATANTYEYDNSLRHPQQARASSPSSSLSTTRHNNSASNTSPPPRNSTAAPPIYLLLLAVFVPIGTAFFICVSRWFDFHHHGIDIFSGALIGALTAWLSFRYYHMPIRRGSGWAWGARSRGRAFWVGVGRDGYVGEEGWIASKAAKRDLEAAAGPSVPNKHVVGAGIRDRGDVEGANGPGTAQQYHLHQQQDTGYTIRNPAN